MVWAQRQLSEKASFPQMTDAVKAAFTDPDDPMTT
jgi:hypothetical protein